MSDTFCGYDGKRDEAIVAYLYGELTAPERTDFMRHLRRCAVCQDEIDALGGVRAELAVWSPPDSGTVVERTVASERSWPVTAPALADGPVVSGQRSWRSIPAWAQVAAAALFLGLAAGIANVDITLNRDGVSLHTGWAAHAAAAPVAPPASTAPVATQAELEALAGQLRAELANVASSPAAAPAADGTSDAELVRRLRALIKESEQRQQRELALRVAEVAQDVQAQRQADLVRIDRTLGALQSTTGTAVRRQEQLLNSLAVRVSQKQ